jgi:hypothetical protein
MNDGSKSNVGVHHMLLYVQTYQFFGHTAIGVSFVQHHGNLRDNIFH